jgi:hypothetical protein
VGLTFKVKPFLLFTLNGIFKKYENVIYKAPSLYISQDENERQNIWDGLSSCNLIYNLESLLLLTL